jgi:hypothetical protein
MPESPTGPSPDIERLVKDGHTVVIEGQYIVVENVAYVAAGPVVRRAAIISAYDEKAGVQGDHTVWFTGCVPHNAEGESLQHVLIADTNPAVIANRQVQCRMSYKSERADTLDNFYNKLTHYIRKLYSYAHQLDPNLSASGTGTLSTRQQRSVFHFPNTAIARAGLDAYDDKLKLSKVAIIGLGGTGSYILDALAKTPVEQIHLYDDDVINRATVYRMPGALTVEDADKQLRKTDYLKSVYDRMRVGVESHPVRIDQSNLHELGDCKFVFIAVDEGPSRGLIANYLAEKGVAFIDAGIGVDKVPEEAKLFGRVRVTAIDAQNKALIQKLPTADDREEAVYNNIQVAELNALNAMLAVILYKQKIGFYVEEVPTQTLRYTLSFQRLSHGPDTQA